MENPLVEFCDLVTATREKLGLAEPTPDAIDVTLAVLREFRAFEARKPKARDDYENQKPSKVRSITPAPGGEVDGTSIS